MLENAFEGVYGSGAVIGPATWQPALPMGARLGLEMAFHPQKHTRYLSAGRRLPA